MGRVVLFLSPHLDDAVLSCPAYIQRLVKDGVEIRVATVFTGPGPLYGARRSEDRKAVRALGAKAIHLGFPDAPFRSAAYRNFCGIVFGRAREYPATCRLVAERIEQLIARYRPLSVLAPMAVGNHVDHRLVRDAALMAAKPAALLFYEDRPYAFVRDQVNHVLGRKARSWKRYFAATYVRTYRGRTSDARIMKGWASVEPFPFPLRRAFAVDIQPDELNRALAAIQAYRTQTPDLFTGENEQKMLYQMVPETFYRTAARPIP